MDEMHASMRQWVWKYEVVVRVEGGREWFSLGAFDGNRDMTTEVAHKLFSTIKCRYLRFHVLGFDRVASMRVGVYGNRFGFGKGSSVSAEAKNDMVEYRFYSFAEGQALDVVPVGSGSANSSHWYRCPTCPQYVSGPCRCRKRQRHLRRVEASQAVREELNHPDLFAPSTTSQPEEVTTAVKSYTNNSKERSSCSAGLAFTVSEMPSDCDSDVGGWEFVSVVPQLQAAQAHRRAEVASMPGTPLPSAEQAYASEWILA
jgi:hypothetical protein